MRQKGLISAVLLGVCFACGPAAAETPAIPRDALVDLARHFVARISKGFEEADAAMGVPRNQRNAMAMLPDGEMLFFNITLPNELILENLVMSRVEQGKVLLSLSDLMYALEFPVDVDADARRAEGWYIRESKTFALDLDAGSVRTEKGSFVPSQYVTADDGDIYVPADEVARWFGFEIQPHIPTLQIMMKASERLPVEERLARAGRRDKVRSSKSKPELPLYEDVHENFAVPYADVIARAAYTKNGTTGETQRNASATLSTKGDFLKGTLFTQSNITDKDRLTSLTARYKRESIRPDLLGPLEAHRYELGDISAPRLALSDNTRNGTGMRVSSIDPRRSFFNPQTGITGTTQPGWDVELYRGSQLLETQTTGPDGYYAFENVSLFRSDNDFRVVFYGPQGEIREETLSIPVDPGRLTDDGGVYDVALTFDSTQLYRKVDGPDGEGKPRLTALYEHALGEQSAVQLGFETGTRDDGTLTTGHVGVSTVLGDALVNASGAVDQHGEAGAEIVWRQDFGEHQMRESVSWATDRFDVDDDARSREIFEQNLLLNGPLAILPGTNPRYNLGFKYGVGSDSETTTTSNVGFSTTLGRLSLNQRFDYTKYSDVSDATLNSFSTLRGSLGSTRLRFDADYAVKPEAMLNAVTLNAQRTISEDLDFQAEVTRRPQEKLTTYLGQANIRTGVAVVSPSLSYNSSGDVAAMVNTSFGIAPGPTKGSFEFSDDLIAANGGLEAFVYLDRNGDGTHQDGEDPIPEATVMLLQNGGAVVTDENGYALFKRMQNFRHTDVYLVPESLPDPYWLPADRGVSIIPREGHKTRLEFPVVMAGEMDGTVFVKDAGGQQIPMRGVSIGLYNHAGEKIISTVSESDGFYILSPIPPGDYFLIVDNAGRRKDEFRRPDPAPVSIGYDGTTIYANNIYLDAGVDVPLRILADRDVIAGDDPAFQKDSLDDKSIVLNLGSYHSRVLMGVMWFRIQKEFSDAAAGLAPLVDPAQSFAAVKTGRHTLRLSARALTLDDANRRCGILNAAGFECAVEILPGGLDLAAAQ